MTPGPCSFIFSHFTTELEQLPIKPLLNLIGLGSDPRTLFIYFLSLYHWATLDTFFKFGWGEKWTQDILFRSSHFTTELDQVPIRPLLSLIELWRETRIFWFILNHFTNELHHLPIRPLLSLNGLGREPRTLIIYFLSLNHWARSSPYKTLIKLDWAGKGT